MFKIITKEKLLDELLNEIDKIGMKLIRPLEGIFYEKTYYMARLELTDKIYDVQEPNFNEKLTEVRYFGGSILDYIPKNKYYLKFKEDSSADFELITLNNVLEKSLTELDFSSIEIEVFDKKVVLNNYFNNMKEGYSSIASVKEIYNKIIEENEIYNLFVEYRIKTHKLHRLQKSSTIESAESAVITPHEEQKFLNTFDFTKKLIECKNDNSNHVNFRVKSKNSFLAIVNFLAKEDYEYFFQNTNEESDQYNLGIKYAKMQVLCNSEYFNSLSFDYYKNKIFKVDFYNKILSFWEEPNFVGNKTEEKLKDAFVVV